jgi:hypothetical protein
MKTIIKIMLLPISTWAACTNHGQQTKDFIPGVYVNHAQSEYSIASDTLVITHETATETGYRIIRKTGFSRIMNGKTGPEQHKVKSFTGIWDAQKQTLQLTQNGIIVLFQPDENQLEVQNSKYHKITSPSLPGRDLGRGL